MRKLLQPNNRFVEKNGLELKGKFVGHTAHVVKEAILSAMGGCLFIDEAYALADAQGDSFSGEAVRTLLTEVENNRSDILVILAGCERCPAFPQSVIVSSGPS